MKAVFYGVLAFLLFIAAVAGLAMYSGFAISLLWGWLIIPVLAVPAITTVQGMGISTFVSYFLYSIRLNTMKKDEDKSVAERVLDVLFNSFGMTTAFILIGWVVSLFM